MFRTRQQVTCEMFTVVFVESVRSTLSKIFYLLFVFDSNRSFKTVKCSFFNQIIIVYQSFYGVLLTFSYFLLQGKVLCFGTCRQVNCEMFILSNLVEKIIKNYIIFLTNHSLIL